MNNYELQMLNIDQYTISSWKPVVEIAPNCPRCDSPNTKFCYYNNYSLSQPRYFCKSCRRYWTKGGALRNVPVGGGCRKKRRSCKKLGMRNSNSAHHQNRDAFAPDHKCHAAFNGDGSSVTSDIDLSEIYAKYANGSVNNVSTETMENEGDSSLVDEIEKFFSFPLEDEVIDCEFGTMPVIDGDISIFNPCSSYYS